MSIIFLGFLIHESTHFHTKWNRSWQDWLLSVQSTIQLAHGWFDHLHHPPPTYYDAKYFVRDFKFKTSARKLKCRDSDDLLFTSKTDFLLNRGREREPGWTTNNLTEKLNVHFYCAIYKAKHADIKHKTHRGSYPQWFEDKKKTDRGPITAIMVKTSFVAAHFSSRGQRPILMSTLRNIFVHMVPGDTKFFLGNIDLNLNWQCLGLTIICRSKGMYVNITPITIRVSANKEEDWVLLS